jgi:O-methyltransferase
MDRSALAPKRAPAIIRKVKTGLRRALRAFGYDIVLATPAQQSPIPTQFPPDFDDATVALFRYVQPYTMTSKERVLVLRRSVEYIVKQEIAGDIVECGVWKGGSMMAIARTLMAKQAIRTLYLFDTFEGMTEPSDLDKDFRGETAAHLMAKEDKSMSHFWAYSSLDEVKHNMRNTGYDERHVVFVKGKVEDTIPANAPGQISLLRLDTDWFDSTYHELVHLYPRLSTGGVLIIDDYGHWEGARRAVDQYIEENHLKLLLNRIDYSGRICVKLEA